MATIGQAFSPGMLAALTNKEEGRKNRNMQAALSDRQNRMQVDSANASIDAQNASLQQQAQATATGGAQAKQQMELLKEQGRNDRAERGNQLKEALGIAKQETRDLESASRGALRGANIDLKKMDLLLAQGTHDSNIRAAAADAALLEARGDTEGARSAAFQATAALNRERAGDMRKTRKARIAAIKDQSKNYLSLIEDRKARASLSASVAQFNKAFKIANFNKSVVAMRIAHEKFATEVNLFGQSLQTRAKTDGAASTSMAKMVALNDLLKTMGEQLDNALMTGSHNPNRTNGNGPTPGSGPVSSAADDAAGVFKQR